MTKTKLTLYLVFLLFQAIWLGSGFHSSVSSNGTWYSDPLTHIHHQVTYPVPGEMNAWPISTGLLAISTLVCVLLFFKYKESGRTHAFIAIYGTLVLIIVTFLYFVPTLGKIFGDTGLHSDEELISLSRQWVILNCIRLAILTGLFITALLGLSRFPRLSSNN